MSKLFAVVSAPVTTVSGYGARSRDFVKALFEAKGEEWDIKILPQRWGSTPMGALDANNPEDAKILDNILFEGLKKQPDIFINISVSNEFQPVGKYNIGVSALVETTLLPPEMLEGMNRVDLNIVSSTFAKGIAENAQYDRVDQNTNSVVGRLKLDKKVEVLFEGVDTEVFDVKRELKTTVSEKLDSIKESFCFLMVGHWLPGIVGEDRKQMKSFLKAFLQAFKGKAQKPALVLKTSLAGFSLMEQEAINQEVYQIINSVGDDCPSVYIMHGDLSPEELCELYKHPKIKALAQVGNEGFGRPALEFSAATSKLVIASPFGGHTDFLASDKNIFVGGALGNVHESAANNFLMKEGQWFKLDIKSTEATLKEVYNNYSTHQDLGKRQGYKSRTEFSYKKMVEALKDILDRNVPVISKPVALKLPKLTEIKKPEGV